MLGQRGTKLRCQTIKWDVGLHPLTCSLHIPPLTAKAGQYPISSLTDWRPSGSNLIHSENSHFQSQRSMVLSQFCKGPEKLVYPENHLTPDPSPQDPCHGPPYLSRHVPRTSLAQLDPTIWPPRCCLCAPCTPLPRPLHLLAPLPGMLFCHILTWFASSSSSHLYPNVTFSVQLSLAIYLNFPIPPYSIPHTLVLLNCLIFSTAFLII